MRDGSPVEGAKLTLSADFTGENEITYSDKDGKFDLSAIREFRFTALLIGDPLYRYQVQIEYEGATYLGFGQASIGNPNELVTLSCDLNKPTKWMAETVYCKG